MAQDCFIAETSIKSEVMPSRDIYSSSHLHSTKGAPRVPSNNLGGARGVVVIAVGNEHGDTSSNPGRV